MKNECFISGVTEKYPKELIKDRIAIESCVIASIWKDCLVLDDSNLELDNFITIDGRYYFSLASHLRKKGYSNLDEVTVISNLKDGMVEEWEDRGGYSSVKSMTDVIDLKNYDIYIDNLYKSNIILGMYRDGFNLLKEIEENGKKFKPLSIFEKLNSESVLEWYESRLSTYGTGYSTKVIEEQDIEFDDKWIENCEEGLESGVEFATAGNDIDGNPINVFPFLSSQVGGIIESSLNFVGGYSSVGKTTFITGICMSFILQGRKILIISNEQKISAFKTQFLMWVLRKYNRYYNLTKSKFIQGNITKEDKEQIKIAQDYWNKHCKGNIRFISIADSNMALVKKKIREYVLRYGYDTFVYDTFKCEFDDGNKREYIQLIQDSRELDSIAKKYNIIGIASMQLAAATLGKLFLDNSVLSMSKQVKEVLNSLLLMRIVYAEELDEKNKLYVKPFRKVRVGNKWVEEDFKVDPSGVYRMCFIDKSRTGSNSGDTGTALLLKFDGSHGVFTEYAYCRPKHGYVQ